MHKFSMGRFRKIVLQTRPSTVILNISVMLLHSIVSSGMTSEEKNICLQAKNMDYGRVIENIVAIELKRRGYELYVGVLYHKEIDFVAVRRNEKVYIQVADNISDEQTFNREVSPLLSIRDAYPRILLARTGYEEYQYEGIRIIDLSQWLTDYSLKMKYFEF